MISFFFWKEIKGAKETFKQIVLLRNYMNTKKFYNFKALPLTPQFVTQYLIRLSTTLP